MTGGEAAHGLRHIRPPAMDHRQTKLVERLPQQSLAASRGRRRQQELAARQRFRVIVAAVDADQLLDLVVVRGDVLVFDRPGNLPAVARGALEVEVRVSQAHASPDVGLATVAPHSNQLEGTICRRQVLALAFGGVEEESLRVLTARFALTGFPGLDVRPEVGAIELRAGIEQQDIDPLAREVPGRHAA